VSGGAAPAPLVRAAAAFYRASGRFAWHFARAKLAQDPVFAAVLARGLLAGSARILDLGCGQGLLAAWLLAAHGCHTRGADGWPAAWPAPPLLQSYCGIEINAREVARARRAFSLAAGASMQIVHGDVRDVDYAPADAVIILDVLHYLDYSAQERVLRRVRSALAPHSPLLLRIGDAAGGSGFTLSKIVDQAVVVARRGRLLRLYCRTLPQWQALLAQCGFRSSAVPMSGATRFVNVLLQAEAT
jgi:SAM-dependent methyltransferase